MIAELLRLRFEDGDVKHKLENAQTKTQTALAWQIALAFFYSHLVLSLPGNRFLRSIASLSAHIAKRNESLSRQAT
ncbi:hypothetical protein GN958_ATG01480 [Phytophthora infestans]|uniref:Uncharacterized protein n=1 Tax=Phytophthora infestans TaxID=4787 RepID=A0A8S9V9Q0_PHYIN|nr:hypothetical protein GN958_ATG01480 [Phytophthora infestans]